MFVAIAGFVVVALAHSALGERLVVGPVLIAVKGTPTGAFLRWIVRVAWHLTSLAWLGLAAALATSGGEGARLAAAAVATTSGVALFTASRGRHFAWVIFAAIALALLQAEGVRWLPEAAAVICALLLGLISALHLAWAGGLAWGLDAALPTRADGSKALRPTRGITVVVALAAAAAATLALMLGGLLPGPAFIRPLGWAAALVFSARGVGDFSYAGLFKRHRKSAFARRDDRLFTPLCFALSAGFVLMLA